VCGQQQIDRFIEDPWLTSAGGVKLPQQALDEAASRANEVLATKH
jgi:hypothetical protein